MKAFFLGALFALFTTSALADWPAEENKINYLLTAIQNLEAEFIRGGVAYTGEEAAKHLRRKLDSALGNVPEGETPTYTVIDFIERIASKSMITGELYLIRFPDGHTVTAREWLYEQLKLYKP